MIDFLQKMDNGFILVERHGPNMLLRLGYLREISSSMEREVISIDDLNHHNNIYQTPIETVFDLSVLCTEEQFTIWQIIFQNRETPSFAFSISGKCFIFDGILSDLNVEMDSGCCSHYICNIRIHISNGISVKEKGQDINTMSIYEIMEHVHKRITVQNQIENQKGGFLK